MRAQQAYNSWAQQYDTNKNKTRDLEALALRASLENIPFETCLETGCGTGKNTAWLAERAKQLVSVDFSAEMLARARQKVTAETVEFIQADLKNEWTFATGQYDLVVFSLVLEHMEDLDFIFRQAARVLCAGGYVYIGELHPFKQYLGSKARFDTEEGEQVVECYTHHLSDFVQAAKRNGLRLYDVNEYFDEGGSNGVPRVLTILLQKLLS